MSDEQMVAVYRHDAHKMRGRGHNSGVDELGGISVNADVPYGADSDAAALSRPSGKPQQTVEGHETHYRLSLITGDSRYDPDSFALHKYEDRLLSLLRVDDATAAHERWLSSPLAAGFSESVYYPTTSLKYHTLLVAALVDCYRSGAMFDELRLVVDSAERVVAHRTVFSSDRFSLRVTDDAGGAPSAPLGSRPERSWATVWQRLEAHPLDTASSRFDMTLDANLRRIQAWSTALQYLEDWSQWRSEVAT